MPGKDNVIENKTRGGGIIQAKKFGAWLPAGVWDGAFMTAATLTAGGLDYLFQLLTGRWLTPAEFAIFVALTGLLRVVMELTNVIRNVTAHYTTHHLAHHTPLEPFIKRMWQWAGWWGLITTAVILLLAPLLSWWVQASSWLPAGAAACAVLLLFLRPVTDGVLQGSQKFMSLGVVMLTQASLRLGLAWLIFSWWGGQASGAILSLPLASLCGLLVALWLIPFNPAGATSPDLTSMSRGYSTQTLLGLLCFALLVNMDALLVSRFFTPEVAGNYAPIVTIGKINLFVPLAMGLVLFPKATQRHALGLDPRPVLWLALAATLLPGLAFSALLYFFQDTLVPTLFSNAYAGLGVVLPLVGLATTGYAGLNIWLNYALSVNRPLFVVGLGVIVLLQAAGLWLSAGQLVQFVAVMAVAGLAGNVWGAVVLSVNYKG